MHDSSRVGATLIIWTALTVMFGILAGALIATNAEIDFWGGVFLLILLGTLFESAAKGTKAVWKAALDQDDERAFTKTKRTRRNRIERLVESLDDDEIYDLEALLLAEHEGQRSRS